MNKKLEKSLMPNEITVKEAKFTKALFAPGAAIGLLLLTSITAAESGQETIEMLFTTIFFVFILFIPGLKYHLTNVLAVTNKKIYGRTGLIKTDELESPISKIQNIKIQHSIIGRILKYGTIVITTESGLYSFKYVNKPEDFRKTMMSQIEASEYDKMDVHANKIASAINVDK